MTTHEVLVAARNLISDEKDWRGPGGPRLGSVCAAVAVNKCIPHFQQGPFDALGRAMALHSSSSRIGNRVDVCDIFRWNDSHSHAEVLAAFDKAIAATAPEPDTAFLNDVPEAVEA